MAQPVTSPAVFLTSDWVVYQYADVKKLKRKTYLRSFWKQIPNETFLGSVSQSSSMHAIKKVYHHSLALTLNSQFRYKIHMIHASSVKKGRIPKEINTIFEKHTIQFQRTTRVVEESRRKQMKSPRKFARAVW